jgi:hypothetical protein
MLTFTDQPPQVFEIPRLEDHLIDELFYQEDEIGEMRHTAFMIECGLEEDPPDGPDIPPIPWMSDHPREKAPIAASATSGQSPRIPGAPPSRSLSLNYADARQQRHSLPNGVSHRKLVSTKSFRKSHSADTIGEENEASPATGDGRTNPVNRAPIRLVKAKSGSLHGLRDAARKAIEAGCDNQDKSPIRRKLVASKSGTLHGMRAAAEATKLSDSPPKSPVRKLVVTKSGTLHGMRTAINGTNACAERSETLRAQPVKRGVSSQSRTSYLSDSTDSNLGSFESEGDSDVSLDTDDDAPKITSKRKDKNSIVATSLLSKTNSTTQKSSRLSKDEDTPLISEGKSRNRVFKNGRLVSDDAPESPLNRSTPKVNKSVERFRNGASARDLLAEARGERGSLPFEELSGRSSRR